MPFCSRAPRGGRPLLAALLLLLALATGAPSSFASANSAPGSGHLDGQPHLWEHLGTSGGSVLIHVDGIQHWQWISEQSIGAVHNLALGVDGFNVYAATEQGIWRFPLPRPAPAE